MGLELLCCRQPRSIQRGFEKTMFGRREVFSGCHSNIYHKTPRPLCEGLVLHIHGVHNGVIMAQRRAKKTRRVTGSCRSVEEIEKTIGVWYDWLTGLGKATIASIHAPIHPSNHLSHSSPREGPVYHRTHTIPSHLGAVWRLQSL